MKTKQQTSAEIKLKTDKLTIAWSVVSSEQYMILALIWIQVLSLVLTQLCCSSSNRQQMAPHSNKHQWIRGHSCTDCDWCRCVQVCCALTRSHGVAVQTLPAVGAVVVGVVVVDVVLVASLFLHLLQQAQVKPGEWAGLSAAWTGRRRVTHLDRLSS